MADAKARKNEPNEKTGQFWDGFRWVEHSSASQAPSNPATRKQRRLYVSNLPDSFTGEQLKTFLNEALKECGALAEGVEEVVISAWVSPDKKFAFVELGTLEAATVALGLSGIQCLGSAIKIGYPANAQLFDPPTAPNPALANMPNPALAMNPMLHSPFAIDIMSQAWKNNLNTMIATGNSNVQQNATLLAVLNH